MDAEERQHRETLQRMYRQRLRKLEEQAARLGPATPPEVQIELDELRRMLESPTSQPEPGAAAAAPVHLGPLPIDQVHEEKIDAVITELRQIHNQYRTMLPPSDLLPRLYKLFRRNTFQERVSECLTEDWVSRIRAAMLTLQVLRAYSPSISRFGTPEQDIWFTDLCGAVQGYAQHLPGLFMHTFPLTLVETHLYDPAMLEQQLPQPLPRSRVDPQVIRRCDERLAAIARLWQQIGYPALLEQSSDEPPAS